MKITIPELRRNPAKLLEALERKEEVIISNRGREVARVVPSDPRPAEDFPSSHPAFGMWADREDLQNPAAHVRSLRRGRLDAL